MPHERGTEDGENVGTHPQVHGILWRRRTGHTERNASVPITYSHIKSPDLLFASSGYIRAALCRISKSGGERKKHACAKSRCAYLEYENHECEEPSDEE